MQSSPPKLIKPLIWVDCEMTGLDIERNSIIEIAVIVTDGQNLDLRIKGPEIVIHCSDEELSSMNDWCIKTHTESGLVDRVRASTVTLEQAEAQILTFLTQTCHLKPFTCPIAGNSVGEDKRFLFKDMPNFHNFLHYRVIDVSTVKELALRFLPEMPMYKKKLNHRALEDIEESIEELKFYKERVFDKALI